MTNGHVIDLKKCIVGASARAVILEIEGEKVLPNFCVFNRKQMEEITPLFEAIKCKVEKAVLQVKADLYAYYYCSVDFEVYGL